MYGWMVGYETLASCNIKEGQRQAHGHGISSDWLVGLPRGLNSDNFLACSASIRSIATCTYTVGCLALGCCCCIVCVGGLSVAVVWGWDCDGAEGGRAKCPRSIRCF